MTTDSRLSLTMLIFMSSISFLSVLRLGLLRFCTCYFLGEWNTKSQTESMKHFIYTRICLFLRLWSFPIISYALLPLDNNMQTLHLCKFLLNLALCVLRRINAVSGSSIRREKKSFWYPWTHHTSEIPLVLDYKGHYTDHACCRCSLIKLQNK